MVVWAVVWGAVVVESTILKVLSLHLFATGKRGVSKELGWCKIFTPKERVKHMPEKPWHKGNATSEKRVNPRTIDR